MFLQLSIFIKVFYLDFSGKDSTCHAGGEIGRAHV